LLLNSSEDPCIPLFPIFCFWTDGKRFAEFLLEEEKIESAKSLLKQNNNHQETEEKEQTVVLRPATHCTKGKNKNCGG